MSDAAEEFEKALAEFQKIGVGQWPPCTCEHLKAPLVKSYYSDEMVRRGWCPDCQGYVQEMD